MNKFTYSGKESRYISKLFKNAYITIASKTGNSLKKHLQTTPHIKNEYDNGGVYKLKCEDFPKYYIGQTGRTFHKRCDECIPVARNNKDTTGYAQHISNTGHSYGPIDDTMEIMPILKKANI
jgi:hypothetical protein